MAIRQVTSSEEVKRPLGRFQPSKHQTQDYYDLHSAVELIDVKNIINNHKAYIELVDYGYLQLMEISGKDLGSLSYNEVNRTLDNFEKWITDFNNGETLEKVSPFPDAPGSNDAVSPQSEWLYLLVTSSLQFEHWY